MATEQQHFDASRSFQEYYQTALRNVGVRVPAPSLGQTVNNYRRETLRTLKRTFLPQNHDLYQVNCRGLPADALEVFEPQFLRACADEAVNPAHVPPGELRKIERLDAYGKVSHIDWIGQESFVRAMGRPGRRVVKFLAPSDSYGRSVRELA
jgi:hypothetical protein